MILRSFLTALILCLLCSSLLARPGTVRTKDGGLSAQFEHTVLMTEHSPEPLTLTKNGPQRGHKF